MQALIFRAELLPAIQTRVDEVELERTLVLETGIQDLTHQNSDQILLVPFPALQTPDWPALRVRLAQACRMFIVVGTHLSTESVMLAARDGAHDVLDTKDSKKRWNTAIQRAGESQHLWLTLYGAAQQPDGGGMIGESAPMKALRQTIDRIGVTDVSVLVMGESGTGKERIAESLHRARGAGPFVAINCAAIPKDLLEAELFGAEKGAFTGAVKSRKGLVEQANGGTLFLDEIGELDVSLQPKLLRFLETKTARRVGGQEDYQVSLRVVSATNQRMEQSLANGAFRADLFYRLSEVTLHAPPLRNRVEDIALLVRAFIDHANERFGKNIEYAEPELIRKLQAYAWPGNVRELKSAVERLVLLYDGPALREGFWQPPDATLDLPTHPGPPATSAPAVDSPASSRLPSKADRMDLARQLLAEGRLSLTEVAARLAIHPTTLFRWRKSGLV